MGKLTAVQVEKAKTPRTDCDGLGLRLVITEKAVKKWVLELSVDGRRREFGLGVYPEISLAQAREMTLQRRRDAAAGRPVLGKRQQG
jgi:hypothetical protein